MTQVELSPVEEKEVIFIRHADSMISELTFMKLNSFHVFQVSKGSQPMLSMAVPVVDSKELAFMQ